MKEAHLRTLGVAALVISAALGVAVLSYATGAPPTAERAEPTEADLTDEERREYHRYLMSSDCSGVVSTGCKPRLARQAWVRAWREGVELGADEPEMDLAYRRYFVGFDDCAVLDATCEPLSRLEWERGELERAAKVRANLAEHPPHYPGGSGKPPAAKQSKRRAHTKSKSTQRQAEPPQAMGISPDDPLGDLLPAL